MSSISFAHQSSTVDDHEADLAIDGNVDTCSITQSEDNAFFEVVFAEDVVVTEVVIDNRGDCCGRQLIFLG